MKKGLALAVFTVSAIALGALANDDEDEQVAISCLMRPVGGPDPDASGKIKIESENEDDDESGVLENGGDGGENEEEFEVEVAHLDPGASFGVFLDDGAGTLVSIGTIGTEGDGEGELEFESDEGGGLPLGAGSLQELAARPLEVRDATGAVVLFGNVPSFGPSASFAPVALLASLTRPSLTAPGTAKGRLDTRHFPSSGRERIHVRGRQLGGVAPHEFDVHLPGQGWTSCGTLSGSGGNSDDGDLDVDTANGDPLPGGATCLADLAGLGVRVRDGSGGTVLVGTIPDVSAGGPGPNVSARAVLAAGPAAPQARARIEFADQPKRGRSRLTVQVSRAGTTSQVGLWVENPGTGALQLVATLPAPKGRAKLQIDTGAGAPLPFAAASASALAGLAVEIRNSGGGVVASGTVPLP
ncbi:MAG TPA: hypothetical protein VKF62_01900 [Planctomycetota bacterium]|nr:hypothetical protein [Planctomycetota bacterium]